MPSQRWGRVAARTEPHLSVTCNINLAATYPLHTPHIIRGPCPSSPV